MQKISKEEIVNYPHTNRGYKLNNNNQKKSKVESIKQAITNLSRGEALIIKKEDWIIKTSPRQFLSNEMKEIPKTTGTLLDGSGWIVIRL